MGLWNPINSIVNVNKAFTKVGISRIHQTTMHQNQHVGRTLGRRRLARLYHAKAHLHRAQFVIPWRRRLEAQDHGFAAYHRGGLDRVSH